MLARTGHLEISRRVVTYYFLFALAAVVWLAAGAVLTAKTVMETRNETTSLARLGGAASAVRSAAFRRDDFQPLVERFRSQWGLAYCAVVSDERRFLAHSSPERIGQRRQVPTGESAHWGDVQRTRYLGPDARVLREYETTIRLAGRTVGTLLIAMPERGAADVFISAVKYAPAAFICPMLVMIIGAVALRRTVRPVADVERQLEQVAAASSLSDLTLHPVTVAAPVGFGWNRLVEHLGNGTRQHNLETRLDEALETYRQNKSERILNSLPDGVAVTDRKGRITFANKALEGLLGMAGSGRPLCGESIDDCLGARQAGASVRPLLDPNLRGRPVVVEMRRSGDASQGMLRVARAPLCSAGDDGGGHVWSIRDVTQQKLADQMRDQFVNAATHELRTPLTNIKAYAEMLADAEVTDVEQQKAFCNTINEEVTRLARFVDDLLQLSRMEVGSTSLKPQVTDMERLIQDTVTKVRPQMEQKNIAFEVDLPGKLPELVVDKDKVTVALVNLLGNAAKYTPDGGRVRLHVETDDRAMQIHVEDTGVGISVEELPKVFDKFFRSSDPRVHGQTGSGLGLSLTNEIIRLHGGKLTVQSELNQGSKFSVILPISLEKAKCSNA